MKISKKARTFFELADDPTIDDILFGGGAGGGKTVTVTQWAVIQCRKYPGIRIGIGRKELLKLYQTTVNTLLTKTHKYLGVSESEFTLNGKFHTITYINGSVIQLVDLSHNPSDPDMDRLGSLELTHTIIEEVAEVKKKARDIFISRKNRHLNTEYGIVGKSIATCNPSDNWIKNTYYKQYKRLGGGNYQKWSYGHVYINNERVSAYRAFIPALAYDNPFIDPNYIETLRKLPETEKKRLLQGNWDFSQSDFDLFSNRILDRAYTEDLSQISNGKKYVGVDISDEGPDTTRICLIENNVITKLKQIRVNKDKPIGEQIALAIIQFCYENGVNEPHRVAIDVIGVGTSTRDFLRQRNWYVSEFVAGSSSTDGRFSNIRSEVIYNFSQSMEKGELKLYNKIEELDALEEEMKVHDYTTEERLIKVKPKKEVKEELGRSPDRFEATYIAYWCSKQLIDPRFNSNRIAI